MNPKDEDAPRWIKATALTIVAGIGALALGVVGLFGWVVVELVSWVITK
jgi:uncharacterized membrane protein YuzA (DUF378 family)